MDRVRGLRHYPSLLRRLFLGDEKRNIRLEHDSPATIGDLWPQIRQIVEQHNTKRYSALKDDDWVQSRMRSRINDPLGSSDMLRLFNELDIFFQDILRDEVPVVPVEHDVIDIVSGKSTILPLDTETESLTFTNFSSTSLSDMHFRANGHDSSTIDGILESIVGKNKESLTEQMIAERVFEYVTRHRSHGARGSGFRDDRIIRDPVTFFNWIGRGPCGHAANATAVLATMLGLKSRVCTIGFHTIAEILIAGEWAAFDSDIGATYRTKSGKILGLHALSRTSKSEIYRPKVASEFEDFLTRVLDVIVDNPQIQVLATGEYLVKDLTGATHKARWTMMPGEQSIFFRHAVGPWLSFGTFFPAMSPPRERAGFIRNFKPLRDNKTLEKTNNITEIEGNGGYIAHSNAFIELSIDPAFPIVDAEISFDTPSLPVHAWIRTKYTETGPFLPIQTDTGQTKFQFRRAFQSIDPLHDKCIVLEFIHNARFGSLSASMIYDCNPRVLDFLADQNFILEYPETKSLSVTCAVRPR